MKNEKNIMAVKCFGGEFLLFDDIQVVEKYGYDVKQVKKKLKRKKKNLLGRIVSFQYLLIKEYPFITK